jgi:hypothetical protein
MHFQRSRARLFTRWRSSRLGQLHDAKVVAAAKVKADGVVTSTRSFYNAKKRAHDENEELVRASKKSKSEQDKGQIAGL